MAERREKPGPRTRPAAGAEQPAALRKKGAGIRPLPPQRKLSAAQIKRLTDRLSSQAQPQAQDGGTPEGTAAGQVMDAAGSGAAAGVDLLPLPHRNSPGGSTGPDSARHKAERREKPGPRERETAQGRKAAETRARQDTERRRTSETRTHGVRKDAGTGPPAGGDAAGQPGDLFSDGSPSSPAPARPVRRREAGLPKKDIPRASPAPKTGWTAPKVRPSAIAARVLKRGPKELARWAQAASQSDKGGPAVGIAAGITAAAARAAASVIGSLVAVFGGAALLVILFFVLLLNVLRSPFGLFFPVPGGLPLNVAAGQITTELSNRLETVQMGSYDAIQLNGELPDWSEVAAVFAVDALYRDTVVAALDMNAIGRLRTIYWDMCDITGDVEAVLHPDSDPDDEVDDSWTETILTLNISAKTAAEMAQVYQFDETQMEFLDELLAEAELAELLQDLEGCVGRVLDVKAALPDELSQERRDFVETACSLVGKVCYFWGGKSCAAGWDSRWGTLQRVSAGGSSTSGCWIPFGLDCSGFVDWAMCNSGQSGGGTWHIGRNLTAVPADQVLPGDLALLADESHVGVVVGWDEDGNILVCHCSYGLNTVDISTAARIGFTRFGRPACFGG